MARRQRPAAVEFAPGFPTRTHAANTTHTRWPGPSPATFKCCVCVSLSNRLVMAFLLYCFYFHFVAYNTNPVPDSPASTLMMMVSFLLPCNSRRTKEGKKKQFHWWHSGPPRPLEISSHLPASQKSFVAAPCVSRKDEEESICECVKA